jgi:hypothetical protein
MWSEFSRMRVVLHDGKGQWDSTPKDGTKSYYELPSPSQYALMNAKLTEVDRFAAPLPCEFFLPLCL